MAFVSDKYEFVFIHVTKTAGTSIKTTLCDIHDSSTLRSKRDLEHNSIGNSIPANFRPNGINVHDTWKDVVSKYPKAKDYKSFTVFRNPWDRIYSFYAHKVRRNDSDLPKDTTGRILSFNEALRSSNVLLLEPQLWWLGHKTEPIVFESLQEELNMLFEGWKVPQVDLPHLNKNKQKDDYRVFYDSYGKDLIYHYYAKEIDLLGYEF